MNSPQAKLNIESFLNEFKENRAHQLPELAFLTDYYAFFQGFFKRENLDNLTWKNIQKFGDHIHAFQALALSRHNALGNQHHPIDHYRNVFTYLAHGDDDIETRIRNVMETPEYNIRGFGNSVWSEIIGQLFADQYLLFNYRDQFALKVLGIDPGFERRDTFAEKYIKFTKAMALIVQAYKKVVGQQTRLPVNLEVDQFFSYLYEAYHAVYSEYTLTDNQVNMLLERFKRKMSDFEDFNKPGESFLKHELDYKRRALKRFQDELGVDTLKKWLEAGDTGKVMKELPRLIGTNMVQFNSWRISISGETDDPETITAVLNAFLGISNKTELKPGYLKSIFQAIKTYELKPAWDTLSVLLWAFNPELCAPIKIRYYRKLAKELGQELPTGRPSANAYCRVMEWMQAFYTALEPLHPSDWIDVQSFIWVVCSGEHDEVPEKAVVEAIEADDKTPEPEHCVNQKDQNQQRRKIWVIAPGENARLWDEWQRENKIAIGWDDLGDLTQYPDRESIREKLKVIMDHDNPRNDSLACYQFGRVMKPGDTVLVKRGVYEIIGLGEITSDYIYDNSPSEYHHFRKVIWMKTGHWRVPNNEKIAMKTLTDFTGYTDWLRQFADEHGLDIKIFIDEENVESTMPLKPNPLKPYTITDALDGLFMDESRFNGILDMLGERKNIILQGPPGVGKSFIAKRIAYSLIGYRDNDRVQMIQFHQSYSYEDFIQGFRPNEDGSFTLCNGVFFDFCQKAREDQDVPHVFIIDEINRGNMSKIFGELMLLIEHDKRHPDFAIPLTYSRKNDERFYIPPNVHLIGMMNTADRSLAMVDYALRRRFNFIGLAPAFNHQRFKSFMLEHHVDSEITDMIIHRMSYLNNQIASDNSNLGEGYRIGHSFFCPPNGDGSKCNMDWYNRVIRYEIEPLLREYWFEDRDKAEAAIRRLNDVG